jgi:2-polyprenyl-6-methoxyphenol hydroxylase-like FAD-dependent oxidoreductase
MIGARAWRWRPPGQVIVTGIGGGLEFAELRQAVGDGWSGGCVTLGGDKSWIFATIRQKSKERGAAALRAYGVLDRQAEHATAQLTDVLEVRPWSVRVRRWAADGVILIGDAAHAMLPHLGLGGSMTLEDIPVMTEVVSRALRTGDTSAASLSEFQRRRRRRISYARRVSEMWALSMTSRLPGMSLMRDFNFWRISKQPAMMETFLREMAGTESPRLRTRLNLLLP